MHRLDRHPSVDEAAGQVVEQLGMRRRRPADAEIVRGLDDALAEVVLPDPVHEDARRQRIGPVGDPLGQLAPPAALPARGQPLAAEHLEEAAGNLGAEIPGFPADQHPRVLGLRPLRHRVGGVDEGQRLGEIFALLQRGLVLGLVLLQPLPRRGNLLRLLGLHGRPQHGGLLALEALDLRIDERAGFPRLRLGGAQLFELAPQVRVRRRNGRDGRGLLRLLWKRRLRLRGVGAASLIFVPDDLFVGDFLVLELLDGRVEQRHLGPVGLEDFVGLFLRNQRHEVARDLVELDARERVAGGGEDPVERVVVLVRDGVELVVVAARAADGKAQEGLAEIIDRIVDDQVLGARFARREAARRREVSRGDDLLVAFGLRPRGEQVAGDLLADELVEGFVRVERVDDVVPVFVHLRDRVVRVATRGVGVADDVQPVTAPALPIVRGGQQALDHRREGVRSRVLKEGLHLPGRRRQPDQVEGRPPQERPPVRVPRVRELFLLELREHEAVDRVPDPGFLPDGRKRGVRGRVIAPELPPFDEIDGGLRRGLRGARDSRVRRPHFDPRFEVADLLRAQPFRLLGRHVEVVVAVPDGMDEQALFGIARNHRGARFAAPQQALARIQVELRLHLVAAVALVAAVGQDGADPLLEELDALPGQKRCPFLALSSVEGLGVKPEGRQGGEGKEGAQGPHETAFSRQFPL